MCQVSCYARNVGSFIVAAIILVSCEDRYKICVFESPDEQIQIYNHILNELVEQHFYNFYLGKHEEEIFELTNSDNPDTAEITSRAIRLQNELFNDTARFCAVVLDTIYGKEFSAWSRYENDTSSYGILIRKMVAEFGADGDQVIDSLNNMQQKMRAQDFRLCTARVVSFDEFERHKGSCIIGSVSFSKVFLNRSRTKGILHCNFRCGELCGKGELLVIEKINDRWIIVDGMITWVS